ncbi:MAG: TetR/AcrR family transcriptional regulator [Nitrospiraceae bacterium]|nr:TetR/AcrR family transcriptional regulator [Nitrospiraceae bacterium]
MKRRTSADSRKNILEAAAAVFAEYGYSKTTIREVARRAGISVGGIYLYYRNKEKLYLDLVRGQMETFAVHTSSLTGKPPLEALKALIKSYLDFAVNETGLISVNLKEHDRESQKPLKKAFARDQKKLIAGILEKGVREGAFREMDCNETAALIFFSLRGMILSQVSGDLSELKRQNSLYELLLRGIKKED